MDDDFTPIEQTAIVKAATKHLGITFTPADAQEIAYDIARNIRQALSIATLEEAAFVLYQASNLEQNSRAAGLAAGSDLLRQQTEAIRADLEDE